MTTRYEVFAENLLRDVARHHGLKLTYRELTEQRLVAPLERPINRDYMMLVSETHRAKRGD